ncbi:hypothetical protein [Aureimonas jatrophae]|nr:hypothetical protein [Aureimonas jatrophae]MBB3949685.1 hypothetical protein [Aureimonas jatrophae]
MHMSPKPGKLRFTALPLLALGLSACNTTTAPQPIQPPSGTPAQQPMTASGTIPDYCPQVSLREGTATLRKGEGEALQYVASITSNSRSCRVRDGEFYMEVGITGRIVPGPAAKAGNVTLPVRVAIVNAGSVAYSELGQQGVRIDPAGGPVDFTYVDRNIRIPLPQGRTLTVYVGFDEGAPATAKRTASARP